MKFVRLVKKGLLVIDFGIYNFSIEVEGSSLMWGNQMLAIEKLRLTKIRVSFFFFQFNYIKQSA